MHECIAVYITAQKYPVARLYVCNIYKIIFTIIVSIILLISFQLLNCLHWMWKKLWKNGMTLSCEIKVIEIWIEFRDRSSYYNVRIVRRNIL